MDRPSNRSHGVAIAFWIACGLALAAGVAPLFFGGTANRTAGVIIPYGVAAAAMAINALLNHEGRTVPTLLYFLAGLAIVYAFLWLVAVPLQLAVLGACPPAPEICQPGQQPSLTAGESESLAAGVTLGLLAIGAGFVGLALLYRRKPKLKFTPTPLMSRSRPAMESKTAVSEPEPAAAAPLAEAIPVAAAASEAPGEREAPPEAEPPPEPEAAGGPPPAAEEAPPPLELSAPEEVLELPAPQPEAQAAAEVPPPPMPAPTPPPAPGRKTRTRHPRKERSETSHEPPADPPSSEPPS